jgi:predicted SAM-dependent methyltransferase
MKLHLGCGKCYIPGWTNLDIDIFDDAPVDIIDNAKTLKTIRDLSCDLIYASHILEHFGRAEYMDVLRVWFRKLRKGGTLRLSVPDFDSVVKVYNEIADMGTVLGFLTGGQKTVHDYHHMVFNKESLSTALLSVGFSEIKEWNWRETSHAEMDDYSQAHLPHMDKENGILMSLNLEAIK